MRPIAFFSKDGHYNRDQEGEVFHGRNFEGNNDVDFNACSRLKISVYEE